MIPRRAIANRSGFLATLVTAILALILFSAAGWSQPLDPSAVTHEGSFSVPPWANWGNVGLTMIPCGTDPTPDDGYPGCIAAFENVTQKPHRLGVYDIVPPGGTAQTVAQPWDVMAGLPESELGRIGNSQAYDVLYDPGPPCRLWWTYGTWYVRVQEDMPFLGVSSCDPSAPDPQGLYDVGPESGDIQADPFHTAKLFKDLSVIPQSVADAHFGGKRMLMGGSRESGTRGGSQGPAAYVRPLAPPSSDPVMDVTPLLWYKLTGYMDWRDSPEMRGGAIRHWAKAGSRGGEIVATAAGAAYVVPWYSPGIDRSDYPCSDPSAPYWGDPETPEPCQVPVCWYGIAACDPGFTGKEHLQPSFWEKDASGARMPTDCKVGPSEYGSGTGPHCRAPEAYLLFYDVADLAAVYRNEAAHNTPQPYAKLSIPFRVPRLHGGTTYDESSGKLYVGTGGPSPRVHIFSLGDDEPPPPPPKIEWPVCLMFHEEPRVALCLERDGNVTWRVVE